MSNHQWICAALALSLASAFFVGLLTVKVLPSHTAGRSALWIPVVSLVLLTAAITLVAIG